MTDKEIKAILSRGTSSTFTLDPSHKNEITRSTLDIIIRDVRKHLAAKKTVSVIVIRE